VCQVGGEPVCGFDLPLDGTEYGGPEEFLAADVAGGGQGGGAELVDEIPDGAGEGGVLDHHGSGLLEGCHAEGVEGGNMAFGVEGGEVAPEVPGV